MPHQEKSALQDQEQTKNRRSEEKPVSLQASFWLPNSLLMRTIEDTEEGSAAAYNEFNHELSHTIRHTPSSVRPITSAQSGVIQRDDDDKKKTQNNGGSADPAQPAAAAAAAAAADPAAAVIGDIGNDWERIDDLDDHEYEIIRNDTRKNPAAPAAPAAAAAGPGNAAGPVAGLENSILASFSSTYGTALRKGIESDLKKWIKSGTKRIIIRSDFGGSVRCMVRAAYRDYLTRDILQEIAAKPITDEDTLNERIAEYRALIKQLSERSQKDKLDVIAGETGLLFGSGATQPGAQAPEKRAYELSPDASTGMVASDSRGDRALQKAYDDIDNAKTPEEAWKAFAVFTGNPDSKLEDPANYFKQAGAINMPRFQTRLKNMARMVRDYPELINTIGNMYEMETRSRGAMASSRDIRAGKYISDIGFNPSEVLNRRHNNGGFFPAINTAPGEYDGNHELGHVLAGTLLDKTKPKRDLANELNYGVHEDRILHDAIEKNRGMMFSEYNMMCLPRIHTSNYNNDGKRWLAGQIDLKDPLFIEHPERREITPDSVKKIEGMDLELKPDSRYSAGKNNPGDPSRRLGHLDLADSLYGRDPLDLTGRVPSNYTEGEKKSLERRERDRRDQMFTNWRENPDYEQKQMLEERSERVYETLHHDRFASQTPVQQDPTKLPTASYGDTSVVEMFAEAFADVYAHGNQARPMSIAIVMEYEAKQKEKQRARFYQDAMGYLQKRS